MPKIKLTEIERIMLANQYEILSLLHKDESHGYAELAEALRDGHAWLYDQYLENMSPVLPAHDAEHVLTILQLYRDLKQSYDKLSDKSGIDADQIKFPGFDGNNEAELRAFARALGKRDRFEDVLGKGDNNSHGPTTDIYKQMIVQWRDLGSPQSFFTSEVIKKILAAKVHPDNRK